MVLWFGQSCVVVNRAYRPRRKNTALFIGLTSGATSPDSCARRISSATLTMTGMLVAFVCRSCLREVQCQKVLEQNCAEAAFQSKHQADRLFEDRPNVALRLGVAAQLLGDPFFFAPLEFQQNVLFGREVEEERAVCNACGGDDRAYICFGDARSLEFGDGGSHQSLARL
jgi:hypothetical protein